MAHRPRIVAIPIKESPDDEVIEISAGALPDSEEILGILRGECARLSLWIDTAVEYYKDGQPEVFSAILEASGQEADLDYPGHERDQVRALDTLAAHYVGMGHRERGSKVKQKEHYTRATLLYTTADKILMYDLNHLLGRAYFCMLEGNKMDQADQQFSFVLQGSNDSPNIPALLGKACISFQKKDYTQALFFYRKALRLKPDCPANVRVGLGHCFAKLNKMDLARRAFERALDLEPRNVAAIVALAILDLNTLSEEGIRKAVQSIASAFKIDPENPAVLIHLANHFFYRDNMGKVGQLAYQAYQLADTEAVRAEAAYQLARSQHKQGNFHKAFQYYYQSTQFAQGNASFILPHYGLGQMYIQRKEYMNAIGCFEKILAVHPNNFETLKLLGSLYAHIEEADTTKAAENRRKAREHLSKVIDMNGNDIETLTDLAQLLEQTDPAKSTMYYERVCKLLEDDDLEVPPEIISNLGSLALNQGEYEKARDQYKKALEVLPEDDELMDVFRVTIMWNLARAHELLCDFEEAEKGYKAVLRKDTGYLDAFMRLGCICRDRGQIYESSVWFKEGMGQSQVIHADPWTLIGNLHINKHEWQPAQKKFEHILKMPQYKDDPYSLVALGNIWLETLFVANRNKEKDRVNQDRAITMYTKAIKVQPRNMWAANGIGCVLAQRGHPQEAREIFSQVREATADFLDVWINIAHIYMEQRQHVAAVQMYLNAMKKFGKESDPQLLMYLARAYYRTAKYTECRECLEKATLEQPDNLLIRFNHAFVLQRAATQRMKDDKATFDDVTGAVQDLKTAERIFKWIGSLREEDVRGAGISVTFTGGQARACEDLLRQAHGIQERARAQDESERALRARQEQQRLAIKMAAEMEARAKADSVRAQMEDLKNTRELYIKMTKDILRLPEVKEDDRKSRGGGGRGRKRRDDGDEFVNDSDNQGDWDDGGGGGGDGGERRERRKKEGKSRKRRGDRVGASQSDGEEGGGGERQRKKKKHHHHKPEAKLSAKQQAKIKSRAFISDDSSDDGTQGVAQATQLASAGGGETPPRPVSSDSSDVSSSPSDSDAEVPSRSKKASKGGRKMKSLAERRRSLSGSEASDNSDGEGGRGGGRGSDSGSGSSGGGGARRQPPPRKQKGRVAPLSSDEDSDKGSPPPSGSEGEAPAPARKMTSSEDESD